MQYKIKQKGGEAIDCVIDKYLNVFTKGNPALVRVCAGFYADIA